MISRAFEGLPSANNLTGHGAKSCRSGSAWVGCFSTPCCMPAMYVVMYRRQCLPSQDSLKSCPSSAGSSCCSLCKLCEQKHRLKSSAGLLYFCHACIVTPCSLAQSYCSLVNPYTVQGEECAHMMPRDQHHDQQQQHHDQQQQQHSYTRQQLYTSDNVGSF